MLQQQRSSSLELASAGEVLADELDNAVARLAATEAELAQERAVAAELRYQMEALTEAYNQAGGCCCLACLAGVCCAVLCCGACCGQGPGTRCSAAMAHAAYCALAIPSCLAPACNLQHVGCT